MSHVITHIIEHGGAVKEFHIARQDGAAVAGWLPGAHIVLHFASRDGRTFENHYSLIGMAPAATAHHRYRIAVQREEHGNGGSRCLHDEIATGSAVGLSGPFNSFPPDLVQRSPAARVLLIAGGIGITPLLSMAHALNARSLPFELHYLARNAGRLALMDQLRGMPHATLHVHLSQQAGRADLAQLLGGYGAGDSCYACGPGLLMQGLAQAGARLGWPAGALHVESFGARAQQQDTMLTVELSLSHITVQVAPGTPILDALIAAGVFVSYDCQRGECGNCYTPVLHGQPVHRDICLTPAMRAEGMCTCVSWAAAPGRLVLEL
ncbi:PDR/VanB family oxidoreductase [Janthinobacterium agaricidamnosum]|uniref:Oxidoreductase NAD-binding domain protein n=1 Tax=Janthinobacterium agaricidamnosum NBRC 102515 = DSM 9628 TaxID=1349767 RepID=W0VEX9_9BURK|nr:PDR/VanB family oxidoreductase [Janthinobacterium agaricidamnosum]CDG85907.1 oxidoreductase NAD-binding domain protein [Janthinobacterium agaricidamnosum NBRC 102515 = DSM 9628]